MSKKSHGEGTIVQRRDGRWQASLRVNGTRPTVYGKSEREVRAKLRALQRQADTAGVPAAGRRTVGDLLDAWLSSASNLKPSTVARYRDFYDTYARAPLGEVRVDKVTPDALQRLYANLTPSVADRVHRLLHRAFAVAVLWGWLPSNPADRVLKPAYKASRPALWTRAELGTFLEGTDGHWLQPLWVLLLGTGCRLGEALGLAWADVGLGVAVNVTGTLHRLDGAPVVGEPKTPSAVRTVMVPPEVTDALQRQKTQQDAWREADGWQDTGFVFTGRTGQPLRHSTVQHALKRQCERLGLPPVTPHGLRHLHASLLLAAGLPVPAVSARLGHANPAITMKVYAHALAGQDAQAAQAIGRALAVGAPAESVDSTHKVSTE